MPVAGLPAAAEALLSTLLSTEILSSWKCVGEPGSSVVVLRFRRAGSQPCFTDYNQRATWRRKTPAQRRRDQERAERHRATGEQQLFLNASSRCANSHHDANFVTSPDAATSNTITTQTSPSRLTFDLAGSQASLNTANDTRSNFIPAPAADPQSTTDCIADTDAATPLPPPTAEDGLSADFHDLLERLKKEMEGKMSKLREESVVCAAPHPCQVEDATPQPQRSQLSVVMKINDPGDRADRIRHDNTLPDDGAKIDPAPDPRRRSSRRQAREDGNAGQPLGRNVHAATTQPSARTLRALRARQK